MRARSPLITLFVALSVLLGAAALPDRALARTPTTLRRSTPHKGNRLLRKARVAVRRFKRAISPQKRPIRLDWLPSSPSDFNIVKLVKGFQARIPARVQRKLDRAPVTKLARAHSVSFTQKVDDGLGRGPRKAAVHITRGTVNLPLQAFLRQVPADQWGVKLDHYLGGKVKVYARGADGRPRTQVERMVLSGLPGNLNIRGLNLDMSKVEQREVVRDRAGNVKKVTMFWRVHDSANRTTKMDVGSISFEARGASQTLVTFHSAHLLGKGKLTFPNALVKPTLRSFFSDHVKHYRQLATSAD